MVMHARKPQRISDGYLEKHQAHPYQNSRYGSSKVSYGERYNHERMRDSPNGNSYRSDSPDSASPRSYQSKSAYLQQKIRDKERENRDYKARDKYSDCARSPKDKRRRESRDAEHRTNHDRNSSEKVILHPSKLSSHNASSRDCTLRKPLIINLVQDKREEVRERVARVGDWSEHLSSSGKKYYYNCKTEVSQWEKPREWVERERERERDRSCGMSSGRKERDRERERDRDRERDRERDRDRDRDRERDRERERDGDTRIGYSTSTRAIHDKHSNCRSSVSNSTPKLSSRQAASGDKRDAIYWNSGQSTATREVREEGDCSDRRKPADGEAQSQDMDICSGDSTPTSETSFSVSQPVDNGSVAATGPVLLANALPRLASQSSSGAGVVTPTSSSVSVATSSAATSSVRAVLPMPVPVPVPGVSVPCGPPSGVPCPGVPPPGGVASVSASVPTSSAIPPSVPAPSSTPSSSAPQQRLVYPKTGSGPGVSVSGVQVPVTGSVSGAVSNPPVTLASLPRLLSQITGTSALQSQEEQLSPQKALLTIKSLLLRQPSLPSSEVATSVVTAPLTPLKVDTSHSGTAGEGPPTPTHSESQDCLDARKLSSPASSLSSLQTLSQGSSLHVLRPQGPNLTPSLANYYRDDLVNHVRGWPAELLEKQAQKLSEEAHTLGSLQCTRVSADLKTARSIVRLTEIQATLQEQRVLFIRQQIEALEELKSQHSFMADDP